MVNQRFASPDVLFALVRLQIQENFPDGLVHVILILKVFGGGLENALHIGVDVVVYLGEGFLDQLTTLCHAAGSLKAMQKLTNLNESLEELGARGLRNFPEPRCVQVPSPA